MGPWHHVARRSSGLVTLLSAELRVAPEIAREIIHLGAVALNGVRVETDVSVPVGARVTAYPKPRRYPAAFGEWRMAPVVDHPQFAIFNKPHGVPTIATADNAAENAIVALVKAHRQQMLVTHRLDSGAAGLLVVAKNVDAQASLDDLFRERLVEKHYCVLAPEGLAPGTYVHYLAPGAPPRKGSLEAKTDWELAELVVESSTPFVKDRYPKRVAEYRVRLITGRTHQIRAQFAALGFALVGDVSYGGKGSLPRPFPRGSLALVATCLKFKALRFGEVVAEIPPTWR